MAHPSLGLPPSDATAGDPVVAGRLRDAADRLPAAAMAVALRADPSLRDRYDEVMLRRFLRDYEAHVAQLVRALATGEPRFVVEYGESLVPVYRRRRVRMNDVVSLLKGLEDASVSLVPRDQAAPIRAHMAAWIARMRQHRRLPGDHDGNRLVRFIWKGVGLGDDTVV